MRSFVLKMRRWGGAVWVVAIFEVALNADPYCVVVDGHPGSVSFAEAVEATGTMWTESASRAGCRVTRIKTKAGDPNGPGQKARLKSVLEGLESPSEDPLWLVLSGHGNAQGKEPRFNLEGGDLGLGELKEWLAKVRRPMVLVLGFSSSGAFVKGISGPGRVVVAATRSGEEENWSRFGKAFATALTAEGADGNGDGQVSVFEAWWSAQDRVEAFYRESGRLLTEHAVVEDLGEGRAVGREAFDATGNWKGSGKGGAKEREVGFRARGIFWIASPLEASLTREERERRLVLEERIRKWNGGKEEMEKIEYERGLEGLLLELAEIYERARGRLR